ncbi:MAG: M81 family metallopeptidase [Pseudoxanthomonas sp.]
MKITRRKALALTAATPLSAVAVAQTATATRGSTATRPVRIAVLQFMHETVTFLPFDTVTDDFIYEGSPARGEALLGSPSYDVSRSSMSGFTKVAREHASVELVGIESPLGSKKGSGSGWITKQAYERFVGRMIQELKASGPYDGVYLSLHGAMGVRDVAKPEAELARRVREVVGPKAIIGGTFDPHGNEDADFLRSANLAFCIKYYPHYDGYLQGERCARIMIRAIRGDYKPVSATRKPPIITPSVLQWTGVSPWMDLVQRALVWEAREPDVYVNFFYGFAFADVVDAGMCFEVITNGDPELAAHIADDMAATAWRFRKELVYGTKVYSIREGVTLARQAIATKGKYPVVLADHSDRTGAATFVLEQVLAQGLSDTLIGTIADEKTIEALRKKGVKVGDPFDMEIGGRLDVSAGKPVRVKGTINTVSGGIGEGSSKSQLWVSVRFGNNNVVVISPFLYQIRWPEAFPEIGIDPAKFKVFAIKSRVHFRRGFHDNGYAPTILLVEPDQPFVGTIHLEALPYKHLELKKFYPYNTSIKFP